MSKQIRRNTNVLLNSDDKKTKHSKMVLTLKEPKKICLD